MQIRVAVSKRIGVPKSGFIRANCQCAMELSCESPEEFLREAEHLFDLCQRAVERQLSRAAAGVPEGSDGFEAPSSEGLTGGSMPMIPVFVGSLVRTSAAGVEGLQTTGSTCPELP